VLFIRPWALHDMSLILILVNGPQLTSQGCVCMRCAQAVFKHVQECCEPRPFCIRSAIYDVRTYSCAYAAAVCAPRMHMRII
jgi:hypothetical protein